MLASNSLHLPNLGKEYPWVWLYHCYLDMPFQIQEREILGVGVSLLLRYALPNLVKGNPGGWVYHCYFDIPYQIHEREILGAGCITVI